MSEDRTRPSDFDREIDQEDGDEEHAEQEDGTPETISAGSPRLRPTDFEPMETESDGTDREEWEALREQPVKEADSDLDESDADVGEAETEAYDADADDDDVAAFDGPPPETAYVEEDNRWSGDGPVPTAGQHVEEDPDEPGGVVVIAVPDAPIEQAAAAGLPVVRDPLLDPDTQQDFLTRWTDVQVGFVDDPLGAVQNADGLITEIAAAYSAAFQARRADLGSWQSSREPDTETLRVALQRYRSFLGVILPK